MDEQTSFQSPPAQEYQSPQVSGGDLPQRRRFPKRLAFIIFAAILVLVAFNAFRLLSKKQAPKPTPTPTVQTEATPTPQTQLPAPTSTPTPKPSVNPIDKQTGLDRSKLSLSVQNGSGEGGVALKASDYLKNLGYNVVSTGNADNFNYKNTNIQVKPSAKDYLDLLKRDLGLNYTIGSSSATLSASSSADALVIVGK